MKKKVFILGSTGSIGTATLNVIKENSNLFEVVTLVAGNNIEKLISQIKEFSPKHVYIKDKENASKIKNEFPNLDIYYEEDGLDKISKLLDYDIGVSALVGIIGLKPTYNMLKNGKIVALANKEVLVTGGKLILDTAKKYKAEIRTIDSEHSAIMQCLRNEKNKSVEKILLTASGEPFFSKIISKDIKAEDALKHPTWNMGKKISIDSATMMNKGFEVIEASHLFNTNPENIEVVIEKNSLVHSMVEFKDGTILANIGPKKMELPILYALSNYQRIPNNIEKIDIFNIPKLNFQKPSLKKFKCLELAYLSLKKGHSAQIVLNAADEVVVNAFLNNKISFIDIPKILEYFVKKHNTIPINTIDDIQNLDKKVRMEVESYLNEKF